MLHYRHLLEVVDDLGIIIFAIGLSDICLFNSARTVLRFSYDALPEPGYCLLPLPSPSPTTLALPTSYISTSTSCASCSSGIRFVPDPDHDHDHELDDEPPTCDTPTALWSYVGVLNVSSPTL